MLAAACGLLMPEFNLVGFKYLLVSPNVYLYNINREGGSIGAGDECEIV